MEGGDAVMSGDDDEDKVRRNSEGGVEGAGAVERGNEAK